MSPSRLRKWRALPWADRLALLEAAAWLAVMWILIAVLPFRTIARVLGLTPGRSTQTPEEGELAGAERAGWAIRAAAARTPWPSMCLIQSLAGWAMLRRRRIPATLSLGVAKNSERKENLAAHAWLACGETILIGGEAAGRYTPISNFAAS